MKNFSTAIRRLAQSCFSLLVFLFFSSAVFAQTPIKGRLVDNIGAPLAGASVVVAMGRGAAVCTGSGAVMVVSSGCDVVRSRPRRPPAEAAGPGKPPGRRLLTAISVAKDVPDFFRMNGA